LLAEGLGGFTELIQIPQPNPVPDTFEDEHYVGYYHLPLDLSMQRRSFYPAIGAAC